MEQSDDVERLATALRVRTKQPVPDRYFFLLRVGSNWEKYPFKWEAFRDLAGSLEPPAGAMPIAVISVPSASGPTNEVSEDPFPHVEITISPAVPVQQILKSWIAEIRKQGVESTTQPQFLLALGLRAGDVSDDVRSFLGLSEPAAASQATGPAPDPSLLSETLRSIAEELPSTEITAFDIARAIAGRHPEYASGRLRGMTLEAPPDTASHGWELWRDSVAPLYDRTALARSKHKVIDGRLFLVGLGLIEQPLRDALDNFGGWAPLLLEVDEAVASTGSQLRSFLQAVQFAHGYQSDQASGQDQLDIQGEVNAVCEVITDPEVKPPLAVGLFGAWGTGKSFFMEKMRERVAELTSGPTPRRNLQIVQIRFNAWHYADTSLWASLAVEIFERLVDPEPVDATARAKWLSDRGDPKRAEREWLLAQLETYRTAKVALDGERARLEAERRAVEARLEEASRQRREMVANFTLTDVAGELAKDPRVQKAIGGITDTLELTPAVEELTGLGLSCAPPPATCRRCGDWSVTRPGPWCSWLRSWCLRW